MPDPIPTPAPFDFDPSILRPRIPDADFLAALRRFADSRRGRPFTMAQFDAWPDRPASAETIRLRFGTWRHTLALAGIDGARAGKWTKAELFDNLEEVWRQLRRPPGQLTIRHYGRRISYNVYFRAFGSIRRACHHLARYKRGEITREQLLALGRPDQKLMERRPLSPGLRWSIFERDGHRCVACGREAGEPSVRLEIDHIVPVSAGGGSGIENLRTLCRACNAGKGGRNPSPGLDTNREGVAVDLWPRPGV